jgi:hypothetical protein
MHAGVAQRWDVDTIKIGRILKICSIALVFGCEDTHYFIYKRTISAKSDNRGVICETKVSKNHRNFAA